MANSAITLKSSASMIAERLERAVSGLSPVQSPQSFSSGWEYTLGDTENTEVNGTLFLAVVLAGGDSRTINLVTGNESDPTGDTPLRIATLKEVLIAVPSTNADDGTDTPYEGVSCVFNGSMMGAMGWTGGGSGTKVLLRNQRMAESNPTGIATGADASVTITNLNATDKTTAYVAMAGFRP